MILAATIFMASTAVAQTDAPRRVKSVTSKFGTAKPSKTTFFYNEDGSLARTESFSPADRYSKAYTFTKTYTLSGNEFSVDTSVKEGTKINPDAGNVVKWEIDPSTGKLTHNYTAWDGFKAKDVIIIADHEITACYSTDTFSNHRLKLTKSYKYDANGNLTGFTEDEYTSGTVTMGRKLYKCPSIDLLSYIIASTTSIYNVDFIDWVNHAPDGLSLRPMTKLPSVIKNDLQTWTFTLWTLDAQGYIQSVKIKEVNEDTGTAYTTYTVEYEN